MNDTRKSRNPHIRACLGCQKRKTRCFPSKQDAGICASCMKTGAECVFEAPPPRTPLTRRNLDLAERRCLQLEALLRSLQPGIDINAELKRLGQQRGGGGGSARRADDGYVTEGSLDEDFEWNEGLPAADPRVPKFTSDGMGSVSTTTSGYLGSSSASNILQRISALLSPVTPPESQDGRPTPGSIRVRSSQPPSPTLNSGLAAIAEVGRLIDAYFLFYNSNYPILHERTFRERWEKRDRISQSSSWVPICYMVLEIGQWVMTDEEHESPFYNKARAWLSAQALECGTLGAVQAFLLMGNYVQKRDRPNTGFNMMGIAYRMAIGLGMHRELSDQSQDCLALERRRQVFWTLFCFDSGLSITTGRPLTIVDAFIDVRLPRNIDDSDLALASPVPKEVDYPTTYSTIIAHTHLATVANEIYTKFLSAQPAQPTQLSMSLESAVALQEKLLQWQASLPSYFSDEKVPRWFLGPRTMVIWRARNLGILLWRSSQRFQINRADKAAAAQRCLVEAVEAVVEITDFTKTYSGLLNTCLNWYATYFLFQALLVLKVHHLEQRATPYVGAADMAAASFVPRITTGEAMDRGKECFRRLSSPKSAAGRCLETLDRIHQHMEENPQLPLLRDPAEEFTTVPPPPLEQQQQQLEDPAAPVSVPSVETSPVTYDTNFDSGFGNGLEMMQWTNMANMAADPSLHMLLGGSQMDDLFRGVEGFPGTLDQAAFDYVSGDLYRF